MATFTVTSTADGGAGTLRWAIDQANATAGADTISFNLRNDGRNTFEDVDANLAGGDAAADVFVIRPLSALPALKDQTGGAWINGRSQTANGGNTNPFGPEVVIDGSRAVGDPVVGIQIDPQAHANRIEGLVIQNFRGNGISIVGSDDNIIAGNYIGTDATGTRPMGNGNTMLQSGGGIRLSAAERNLIGTNADGINDEAERNVISSNYRHGIRIQGAPDNQASRDNIIRGNYIGTDSTGKVVEGLGNGTYAVEYLALTNADAVVGNVVTGNVMAGNGRSDAYYGGVASPERNLWVGNLDTPAGLPWQPPVVVNNPNTGIPALNSLSPGQINSKTGTVYLDFDGNYKSWWATEVKLRWGWPPIRTTNILYVAETPAFSIDANPAFSSEELAHIRSIFDRVAEDFAPLNVNVTTVEPPRLVPGKVIRVAIGGSNQDWNLDPDGPFGVYHFAGKDTAFVFSNEILQRGAIERYSPHHIRGEIATVISHEAGHAFGLGHEAIPGITDYNPGDFFRTPIMGRNNTFNSDRTIWWGIDDYRKLAGLDSLERKFGFPSDDHTYGPNWRATWLEPTGSIVETGNGGFGWRIVNTIFASGLISHSLDRDFFSFYHTGGGVSLRVDAHLQTALLGANLNARLELYDSAGGLIARSHGDPMHDRQSVNDPVWPDPQNPVLVDPDGVFGFFGQTDEVLWAEIRTNLPAGRYYVGVGSEGAYGDVGHYQLSGTIKAPEKFAPPSIAAAIDLALSSSVSTVPFRPGLEFEERADRPIGKAALPILTNVTPQSNSSVALVATDEWFDRFGNDDDGRNRREKDLIKLPPELFESLSRLPAGHWELAADYAIDLV
jgi:parallel beta-helix repeat protein